MNTNPHTTTEDIFRNFVGALFVEKREGINGLLHGAVGLSGEAGEVLDIVKKSWVYGRDLPFTQLLEEMGDVIHYLMMTCIKMTEASGQHISFEELMRNNIAKLEKRYPHGFTKEAAIARADKTAVR